MEEPMLAKPKIEMSEPILANALMLKLLETVVKSRILHELPHCTLYRTLHPEPNRVKCLIEIELPVLQKFKILKDLHISVFLKLNEEPHEAKFNNDKPSPNLA
jgi:hypothetical protein